MIASTTPSPRLRRGPTAWLAGVVSAASLLAAAPAAAQPYPSKPVRLVVGFAAGGPSDIVARAFADRAGPALGQTFVVDNRPGANAVLATEAVAAARPDGLTLLAAATNHTMIPALYAGRIHFDAARSFVPVCTLAASATVLVVGPSLPVKTLAELLERVRARPGAVTYATPGLGSSPHLATETFSRLAGVSMLHVPYKGAAPGVTDLIGGQVDLSFATLGSVLPHLKSGKLRALAVASKQRSALVPDVPTFAEAGVPGYVVDTWYGLLAPAGTPPEVVKTLTREAVGFASAPGTRERMAGAGLEPQAVCGDAFAAQIVREIDSNTRLAKALDLKAE